ncbi:hypothetical protein [Streptomyces corynorhini]|uniref:Uncharacterized protein n=1 Tax=Streptomyces corynorhini TaxID=2282652 RepID=A0A370B338_9ACTN|nr:hypothetical protein [Streptomyces corynorhini]RDG36001.1 hypothetical protein DVH02_22375 [Streptomyces corynorhini]
MTGGRDMTGRRAGAARGALVPALLGAGYCTLAEFPRPGKEKGIRSEVDGEDARRSPTVFATASGARHGCPMT